jgi:hypothetical protein
VLDEFDQPFEFRQWLEELVAQMQFARLIATVIALVTKLRDMNTELTKQLANLRRARPRCERMRALEAQLLLPFAMAASESPQTTQKPTAGDGDKDEPKGQTKKNRRSKHPGRKPFPADLGARRTVQPRTGRPTALPRMRHGDEVDRHHPLRASGRHPCQGGCGASHRRGAEVPLGWDDRIGITAAAHRREGSSGQSPHHRSDCRQVYRTATCRKAVRAIRSLGSGYRTADIGPRRARSFRSSSTHQRATRRA